jgi:hypothetical protein
MTTALFLSLYVAPVLLFFAVGAAIAEHIERRRERRERQLRMFRGEL